MSMFYEGKKVLVTGASGLTGSHLMDALLEIGAHVRAVEHVTSIETTPSRWTAPNLTVFKGGLCNIDSCKEAVKDIDYVFHCAAVTSGAKDIIFIKFFALSSRATGPKTRVPIGSF